MSEYQYYEFQALDRPLSGDQREALRGVSSRARITATSFTNEYHWGDLRGNPRNLVERYFDAHLYVAGWGTRRLMLRLPLQRLALRSVQPYGLGHHVETWATRTHLLLDLTSEDEGGDWVEGADDSLAAVIGVREELATGDMRPLYLAWLSALSAWEAEDDDEEEYQSALEPPVPAGLGELTAPQSALADFLRVDTDLLAVAAQCSTGAPEPAASLTRKELARLVSALQDEEKDALLVRLALGPEPHLRSELLHRLREISAPATAPGRRTAARLLDAAHTRRAERHGHAERDRLRARATRLTALAAEADVIWNQAEAHIASKKTSAYDAAVALLRDLRDACAHAGQGVDFQQRLGLLRDTYRSRPGLIHRLDSHGLR
ncbi:hypothetical protein OS965_24160 [Streptomyces sp. H27-G5]|uniref:hypothetical protein n=1 Tax=Streptomyces sp. H27-G5 TaxID=2996698 RepID=UPI00226F9212|nr:hypothetical protein [Streptomyces sp. H27-G5]MCY0921245.1 hypothetical protein [Streptomyces sp. H27-G5]